jgi:hypothetical protein
MELKSPDQMQHINTENRQAFVAPKVLKTSFFTARQVINMIPAVMAVF